MARSRCVFFLLLAASLWLATPATAANPAETTAADPAKTTAADPAKTTAANPAETTAADPAAAAEAHAAGPAATDPAAHGTTAPAVADDPATDPAAEPLIETLADEAGPYATRTMGPDGRWQLPEGDAVLIDEAWWTPLRPLAALAETPPELDPAILEQVRAQLAPAATARTPDRLLAATLGDVTMDGEPDLVVSFRRPFRLTLINMTRHRHHWVDAHGHSAHLGLYPPDDIADATWVAGTLVAPVVEVAACDGALAVAYGRMRRPGVVETGAWRWVVFGFLPTPPLPGPGTPICVDIDGDGLTEPAIVQRSEP